MPRVVHYSASLYYALLALEVHVVFTRNYFNVHAQIMNPELNRIGCGAARCPTILGLSLLPNAVVLVCNYATEAHSDTILTEISSGKTMTKH